MEIVIEIDDKLYERISYLEPRSSTILDRLLRAVQKGTPLPKNHGDLIDRNNLIRKEKQHLFYHLKNGDVAVPIVDILNAPTIIEEVNADE